MPTTKGGDGYGYDIAINPARNTILTSSFTGWNNYMKDLGTLMKDQGAMKNFGSTMVVWNLKSMQPEKVLPVAGAPLEIRWSLHEGDDWAVTASALTSTLWLVKKDAKGEWQAKSVGNIGDPAKIPLPVDMSITADGKGLWVNTFMDGTTRYFDMSNPEKPKQTYSKHTGSQVNMVSQSWDGKRLYISTSLLTNWDKKGADDEQFVKLFAWDGKELKETWKIDFYGQKLGRPHHMKLGANSMRNAGVGQGKPVLASK
jgi:selenium-binding protein 1